MRRFRIVRLLAAVAAALTTVVVVGADASARVDPDSGPYTVVESGFGNKGFAIAHNSDRDEYLAVWQGPDVMGQRLDANGAPLGEPVLIAEFRPPESGGRVDIDQSTAPPKVVYNASTKQFAVTFARVSLSLSTPTAAHRGRVLIARLVSDQGTPLGSEVALNPPLGNFYFCFPIFPSMTPDPGTGGYVLVYSRWYGTTSAGGQCGGLAAGSSVTVVQAFSGSLSPGASVDFPVTNATGPFTSEVAHNPVTNQFLVTQPYSLRDTSNRNGRRFPAQIYTSAMVPVGGLNLIDLDPVEGTPAGGIRRAVPVADPVTGNWFVVSQLGWINLLSPTGESLRTGNYLNKGLVMSVAAVGDGTFVYSTQTGKVVHVRADGTEIHTAQTVTNSNTQHNTIALGAGGSGAGIGLGPLVSGIVSYGFDVVAPGALPIAPARLLETRMGAEFTTIDGVSQGDGQVTGGEFVELKVAGRGGVPADASAVLLNIAAAGASSGGFVTGYPCDAPRPTTSNLNYSAGGAASAAAIAKISDAGTVCLFTSASAHLIVDVNGFVPAGGSVTPVVPARLLETRGGADAKTVDGVSQAIGRRSASDVTILKVAGRGGVADDADAVLVNVTGINPSSSTFLTVYPCDEDQPTAASLNAPVGSAVNNLVTAKVAADGTICLFTSAATDLVVDVAAYVPANGGLLPVVPARILETRSGTANTTIDGTSQGIGRVGVDSETKLTATERGGVAEDATGVMLNVAYIAPDTGGFMTAYPCGTERPQAANLNFGAGDVGSNAVFVKLSASGQVCIYSTSASDLAIDVVGYTVDKR